MPLQELKFWEESFKVYERGLALFKWPHVRDLWQTYLAQFVQRYKGSKLERARDLFRQAIESVSALGLDLLPLLLSPSPMPPSLYILT